jgi:hypothetical protein
LVQTPLWRDPIIEVAVLETVVLFCVFYVAKRRLVRR